MKHYYIHIGIIGLTIITAVAHLAIGISEKDNLLLMNGLGYVALLIALYIPLTPMQNFRTWFRSALLVYTLVTIVGYFALHGGIPTTHAHGESKSEDERPKIKGVGERASVDLEIKEAKDEREQYESLNDPMPEKMEATTRPDYLGLGVKGVEAILISLLSFDAYIDRRKRSVESIDKDHEGEE